MVKGVMTCAQAYSFNVTAKMGTFPKSGEDHNNPLAGAIWMRFLICVQARVCPLRFMSEAYGL